MTHRLKRGGYVLFLILWINIQSRWMHAYSDFSLNIRNNSVFCIRNRKHRDVTHIGNTSNMVKKQRLRIKSPSKESPDHKCRVRSSCSRVANHKCPKTSNLTYSSCCSRMPPLCWLFYVQAFVEFCLFASPRRAYGNCWPPSRCWNCWPSFSSSPPQSAQIIWSWNELTQDLVLVSVAWMDSEWIQINYLHRLLIWRTISLLTLVSSHVLVIN